MIPNDDEGLIAEGLRFLAVCMPAGAQREVVESFVNRARPTGLDHGWRIADAGLPAGKANPEPCEADPTRIHWLLSC